MWIWSSALLIFISFCVDTRSRLSRQKSKAAQCTASHQSYWYFWTLECWLLLMLGLCLDSLRPEQIPAAWGSRGMETGCSVDQHDFVVVEDVYINRKLLLGISIECSVDCSGWMSVMLSFWATLRTCRRLIQSSGFLLSAIQSHYCALPHATKLLTLSYSKIVTIHTSLHDWNVLYYLCDGPHRHGQQVVHGEKHARANTWWSAWNGWTDRNKENVNA